MRKIAQKVIHQWYQEAYRHNHENSIYGNIPEKLQIFCILLQKNGSIKTVLDLGCGDGRSLIEFAKFGFQATGIDLFGKEITESRAQELDLAIRFFKANIVSYPFEKENYDAVIASEVFHLIPQKNVDNVINRMIQATNLGGYIYISILSNLRRYFISSGEEFEYEKQPNFTIDAAKKLLQEKFSGWRIIEFDTFPDEQDWPIKSGNYPLEPYHWSGEYVFIIAQKKEK